MPPGPVVTNSAGCGSHLKELHHLFDESDPFRARAEAFAARVRDLSEVLAPALTEHAGAVGAIEELAGPLTWDDPCHLCHGQRIRSEPREVLRRTLAATPDAKTVPLADSEACCGSAGIYSFARPADSAAILAPKLDALERSGARVLVTSNPGCQMQWEAGVARRGSGVQVVHLAELVARACGKHA